MSYRIGLVQYRNFGPYEEAEVDFSLPGLTGIEGVMLDRPGSDSNGTGKSMLLEGPVWCLWGRCIRPKYSGDSIVRIGSKGGAFVRTSIMGGEHEIVVERYRKHPKKKNHVYLLVDGEDVTKGTDPETQAAIEHLLGTDFATFCNSVAFGAREDVLSFFSATDSQRKAVLDKLLGLEVYAVAERVARDRLSAVQKRLTKHEVKAARLNAQLETVKEHLQELDQSEDPQTEMQAHLSTVEVRQLERAIASDRGSLDEAVAFRDACEGIFEADRLQYLKLRKEYDGLRKELTVQLQDDKQCVARLSGQINIIRKRRDDVDELPDSCPTCLQTINTKTREHILEELEASIVEVRGNIDEASARVRANEEALDGLLKPEKPRSWELETAQFDVKRLEEKVHSLEQTRSLKVQEAKTLSGVVSLSSSQRSKMQKQEADLAHDLAQLDVAREADELESNRCAMLVEAFGPAGLRSFLIESEVPTINKRATYYARRLLGPDVTVKINATTALKSKNVTREKISIEAVIPGCCDTYAGASHGQKRRLDIALLLAFRDVMCQRSSRAFDQLFADELFDGLDKSGAEAVVDLLREQAAEGPVVLVTHSVHLKSAADRMVTVYHPEPYLATLEPPQGPPKVSKPKKRRKRVAPFKTTG